MPNTQQINYIGRVIERNTQVPIGGAKVTFDFQGIPSVDYTDAEGVYRFKIDLAGSNILEGQVWVEADGYKRYNRLIELSPGNTDIGDFRLEKTDAPPGNWSDRLPIPIKVAIIGASATVIAALIGAILPRLSEQLQRHNGTTQSPSPTVSPTTVPLRDLLASGEWKKADEETQNIMLKLAGREKEGFLRDLEDNPADFQKISCPALEDIDKLWVKYSNRRFGFSVQKHIWNKLNPQTLEAFYERLGWTVNQNRKNYDNLTFSLNAPLGHLPAAGEYSQGRGGWISQCFY